MSQIVFFLEYLIHLLFVPVKRRVDGFAAGPAFA
jgi:hypothetical protein